ncbi:MAG: hypothetical protein ACXIU2_01630 [Cyclobacteriaceae bacterium]
MKKKKNYFESILIPLCCSLLLVFVLSMVYVLDFMVLEVALPNLYIKGGVAVLLTVLMLLAIKKRQIVLGYGVVLIACIGMLWFFIHG